MHHSTGRRDRFPSPLHHSTGRRDWFPSPVHHSTMWRDWFPSPLHHSTARRDWFPSLVHHSTGRRDRFPSPLHHSTGRRDWLPSPVHHSTGRRDRLLAAYELYTGTPLKVPDLVFMPGELERDKPEIWVKRLDQYRVAYMKLPSRAPSHQTAPVYLRKDGSPEKEKESLLSVTPCVERTFVCFLVRGWLLQGRSREQGGGV